MHTTTKRIAAINVIEARIDGNVIFCPFDWPVSAATKFTNYLLVQTAKHKIALDEIRRIMIVLYSTRISIFNTQRNRYSYSLFRSFTKVTVHFLSIVGLSVM